jgi:hypothetical protein
MLKTYALLLTLILSHTLSYPDQDVHVATWSTGEPESGAYESLSFWIKDNHRAYIRYAHGSDAPSIDLRWLGTDSLRGAHGFRISSPEPGQLTLYIVPKGDSLHVFDKTHYDKVFHWENEYDTTAEQPCSICAHSGRQAMGWLQRYFF